MDAQIALGLHAVWGDYPKGAVVYYKASVATYLYSWMNQLSCDLGL
jgi:hypothetical protein